ncbi:MAG TPA: amidohydrolase family protein [Acidimicrobiales bacterium]|nr:amidohydrolase family protein [Acidimicrobiales bacterium]
MSRMSTPWPVDRVIPETTWRPPAGTVVISADDHVMEPDLWFARLPAADRDGAPRIHRGEGGYHLTIQGESFDQPGFNSLVVEGREGMADLDARLADMDAEAVDASFLYASRAMGLFTQIDDKEFVVRCYDAYNEWLAELQARAPGRIYGVAVLPTMYRPEATAAYCQKLKELGFVAMQLPSHPRDVRYNASAMEPLWDAIEESGLPVSFHIGASGTQRGAGALGTSVTAALQPFRELWCLLAFSGILERHPGMKVVFTEGGISWVPAALFDADKQYKAYATEVRPKLAELPSFYWFRQCYATFMNDPAGLRLADMIGVDHMLWSVDYPHPEGNLGENVDVMRSIFEQLPEREARAVVGGNAARVWNLDVDAIQAARVH